MVVGISPRIPQKWRRQLAAARVVTDRSDPKLAHIDG